MNPYYTNTAPRTLSEFLVWEMEQSLSREKVTVLAGSGAARALKLFQVLGRITLGAPTITPGVGNTAGSGALGSLTYGPKAKVGTYVITCVGVIANSGRFQVIDPDGIRLADALAGAGGPYVGPHLSFAIADATDFAVGDKFDVAIAAGSGKVKAIDFAATDGSQHAYGILTADVTAPDGVDAQGLAVVRQALITTSNLIWPAGATGDQKNAALAELAAAGILTRMEA